MIPRLDRLILAILCGSIIASTVFAQEAPPKERAKKAAKRKEDAQARAGSLRKLADRLEVRSGATIADIGAGNGKDTWVFAQIVGRQGRVYAEEITQGKVDQIQQEAKSRELPQVQAVLGDSDSLGLPDNSVDMAFMHYVYHHLAKPREMLRGIWRALKPGGYYVVVDRHKGTLVDWVPRADREKKHFWLAETTFVREAREEGFLFVDFGEQQWHAKNDTFVIIMQRPTENSQCGRDPDPLPPIGPAVTSALLPDSKSAYQRIALIALGEGRKLVQPLAKRCQGETIDIVLEEWATQKDERPDLPAGVEVRSVLTEEGDPQLGPETLDAVYFLDTYHLLFHGEVLLNELRERLEDEGRVYVLDRIADRKISHREASHRRMIAPETVEEEMARYGFLLQSSSVPISPGRFLLVFTKR
jgi:SAM-dependent methyltransferase